MIDTICEGLNNILTDCLKIVMEVGAASTTGNHTKTASLPEVCSTLSAYTYAIHFAFDSVKTKIRREFANFNDS